MPPIGARRMPPPPLTHHQILGLVEPFTRSGRQVDLPASDRLARRLHFKPRDIAASGDTPALTETLQLECHESGNHRLTRVLHPADGPDATLQAMGTDLSRLLAQVDAVAPAQHFRAGPGWQGARSYDLAPSAHAGPPVLTFRHGEARVDGLHLGLAVMDVKNVAGDITLRPAPGERLALPEDLLAVMGWNWVRLVPATPTAGPASCGCAAAGRRAPRPPSGRWTRPPATWPRCWPRRRRSSTAAGGRHAGGWCCGAASPR